LTDGAREFLIDKGGDLDYGARPLRRSVESCIEDPLSEEILRGAFEGQNRITVTVKEVGDQKQLDFEGSMVEVEADAEAEDEDEELAAVGSGEPGEPGETGEPGESTEGDGDE
jgi:ATP-dependent Clp protease ATP-binding subunit ClpC